jgi:hypothetical protein
MTSPDLQAQVSELSESLKVLTTRVAILESLSAADISTETAKVVQAQLPTGT